MANSMGINVHPEVPSRTIPWNDILGAAADSLITARCQHAYAHELRAALHPISLAMELLLRASDAGAKKPELLEQASALAKRAMGVLEQSSVDLLRQIVLADDVVRTINLGELLDSVLRLLRADIDQKSICFDSHAPNAVVVRAPGHRLRKILLGIIALSIDETARGATLSVSLTSADGEAHVVIAGDIAFPYIDFSEGLFTRDGALTLYALVLAASRQWLAKCGGDLIIRHMAPAAIEIRYPLPIAAVVPASEKEQEQPR